MATRATALRSKYLKGIDERRPPLIDDQSWQIFLAHIRDGKSLREVSRETGIPVARLGVLVTQVDRALESANAGGGSDGKITLDSPFESLDLSMRARNSLRELGCASIRSVLEKDFTRTIRRFGPVTRQEIAAALERNGFSPPDTLRNSQQTRIEELMQALTELKRRLEVHHQRWRDRLERLEERIRRLST